MNAISPQGIGAVSLISNGMAPILQARALLRVLSRQHVRHALRRGIHPAS